MTYCAEIHGKSGMEYVYFESPTLISELLKTGKNNIDMPCGKQGKCGKCRIKVTGVLSKPDDCEKRALTADELSNNIRLACRCYALGDVEIHIAEKKRENILTNFALSKMSISKKSGIGLAVDIGTTTVAAYLYDLWTAECLATASAPNPQRTIGADVTSRLKASMEGKRARLKSLISNTLSELVKELLKKSGRSESELTEAVITGNTAMLYLLTEKSVERIAYPPFKASTLFGEYISGDKIGLSTNLKVWLPHCVSAYVGADITCTMLYASSLPQYNKKPVLLADIGTNGEMALFYNNKILACSTAAGPAFEGAGIRFGMTACDGAICRADLKNGAFIYDIIGGEKPVGICGTGLIDTVSALIKSGAIDETGRLEKIGHCLEEYIVTYEGQTAFKYPESEIYLTQADIRAVQLAKSAVCAGMFTLCKTAGFDISEIEALLIAGGFGSFIRAYSAEGIGLVPYGLAEKAIAIGNGAGAGAVMMLLSDEEKEKGAAIAKTAETAELASSAVFSQFFIECMAFWKG